MTDHREINNILRAATGFAAAPETPTAAGYKAANDALRAVWRASGMVAKPAIVAGGPFNPDDPAQHAARIAADTAAALARMNPALRGSADAHGRGDSGAPRVDMNALLRRDAKRG